MVALSFDPLLYITPTNTDELFIPGIFIHTLSLNFSLSGQLTACAFSEFFAYITTPLVFGSS